MLAPAAVGGRRCVRSLPGLFSRPPTEYSQPRTITKDGDHRRPCCPRPRGRGLEGFDHRIPIAWSNRSTIAITWILFSKPPAGGCEPPTHTRVSIPSRGGYWSGIDHRSRDCVHAAAGPHGLEPAAGQAIAWSSIDYRCCDCLEPD